MRPDWILTAAWLLAGPAGATATAVGPAGVRLESAQDSRDEKTPITGRLEEIAGQRVLFLWGSPHSQGYAEGYLLAGEIQAGIPEFVLSSAPGMNATLWNGVLRRLFQQRVRAGETTDARIKGLVEGLRAALPEGQREAPALGRELDELDFVGLLALIDVAGFLCSSFAAWDELLEEGSGPMVGRNLDYRTTERMLRDTLVKVHLTEEGGSSWVEMGWPGFMGCLTGISEAGVSVAIHDVAARAPLGGGKLSPRAAGLAQLMDERIDPAELPDRAAEILRGHRFGYGMNVMLAWSGDEPGGAVLEVDPDRDRDGGVSIRGPSGRPYVVCSNHHRLRAEGIACPRYGVLEESCASVLKLHADELDLERAWTQIARASKHDTLYRCVFDLEAGALRFQVRDSPGGEMREAVDLDVGELFARGRKIRKVLR